MANNLDSNPIFIDTSGSTSAKKGPLRVLSIAWVSDQETGDDIAASDDFLLDDSSTGRRIIGKRAHSAGDDLYVSYPLPGKEVPGLYMTTMDGGVCYIELAE